MVDQALILSALPARFRHRLAIAMEGERLRDWQHPPAGTGPLARIGWRALYLLVLTLFGVFPLPKKSGFRRSFAFAGDCVDRGSSLLVFPEGTRTHDGRMKAFMPGIGLLAAHLRLPVAPIRIDGLLELKRRRQYFARPGRGLRDVRRAGALRGGGARADREGLGAPRGGALEASSLRPPPHRAPRVESRGPRS